MATDDQTLAAANKNAKDLNKALERTEKLFPNVVAEKFAKYIRDGVISQEELNKKLKNTDNTLDEINNDLRETIEKLRKAEELSGRWNNEIKQLGSEMSGVLENLTGISLPGLSIAQWIGKAANTTVDWYNHTAVVNREFYDMEANLGNIGKLSYEFESNIRGVSQALLMPIDDVRELGTGLAAIGFTVNELVDGITDVASLTTLWSEVTPEKQMSMMSDYIKEFGMNGREASDMMLTLYNTANNLKDVMPKLDIKAFVDQTHEVAMEMRQYGLEAQDAIALTSTLVKLGVDQARVGELAKAVGGAGMGGAATVAYMATQAPGAGEAMREGGITQVMGEFLLDSDKRLAAQTAFLDEMVQKATGTAGLVGEKEGGAKLSQIVGALSQLDLPGIGKMTVVQAEAFGKAVKEIQLTKPGMSLRDAVAAGLKETEKELAGARELAKENAAAAQKTADNTKTVADKFNIGWGAIGSQLREGLFGPSEEVLPEGSITKKQRQKLIADAAEKQKGFIEEREEKLAGRTDSQVRRDKFIKEQGWEDKVNTRTIEQFGGVGELTSQIEKLGRYIEALNRIEIVIDGSPDFVAKQKAMEETTKIINTGESGV